MGCAHGARPAHYGVYRPAMSHDTAGERETPDVPERQRALPADEHRGRSWCGQIYPLPDRVDPVFLARVLDGLRRL